jgi:hypothetical protein
VLEAARVRAAEPLLDPAVQDLDGRVLGVQAVGHGARAVRGGVVHDEDPRLGDDGAQPADDSQQVVGLVVGREDHPGRPAHEGRVA